MRISFCYIHGISAIDTPYFETENDQTFFFERHEVGYIDTTFYPPHYENSIRVSSEDFTFNSEINYVRFQYMNKWYYYFISSVDYINENLMQVNIEMDVIQTYMFNIEIDGGIIERKFINRWNSQDGINRNYIRENLSNTQFVPTEKNYKGNLYNDDLWIVVKCSENHYQDQTITYNNIFTYPLNSVKVSSTYQYMFIPVNATSLVISTSGGTTTKSLYRPSSYLKTRSPYITDIFMVHGFPLNNGYDIYTHNGIVYLDESVCALELYGSSSKYVFKPLSLISSTSLNAIFSFGDENTALSGGLQNVSCNVSDMPIKVLDYDSRINILNFTKNTSVGVLYNSIYNPVMMDENYILYEYGNDNATTSYPLFNLDWNTPSRLSCREFTDVVNGSKCYYTWSERKLGSSYTTYEKDLPYYSTFVIDTNIPFYDIIVDSENKWLIENHSRLVAAGLQMGAQAIKTIASGATGAFGAGMTKPMSSFTGIGSRDLRYGSRTGSFSYWSLPLKKSIRNAMSDEIHKIGSAPASTGGALGNYIDFVNTGLKMSAEKVQGGMQPNEVKQTGTYCDKLSGMSYPTWERIMKVNDYEVCSKYYHRNGYRVDEYINNLTQDNINIFDYVQNRYYYNILKMNSPNVHLVNIIEDEDTCELIADRLIQGVRLWNNAPQSQLQDRFDIGTYQYDNVEFDYL